MSPESYILLMISGWLMLSAAMLWGMLRLVNRYQLEAQLAEEFSTVADLPQHARLAPSACATPCAPA